MPREPGIAGKRKRSDEKRGQSLFFQWNRRPRVKEKGVCHRKTQFDGGRKGGEGD